MKSEAAYQLSLINKLKTLFPGCHIIKNDPSENQGIPDLLILFKDRWAMLEAKLSDKSPIQANQPYYVNMFDGMSFASFINPSNEEQVLNDLQSAFGSNR